MGELNAALRDIPMPDRIKSLPVSPTGFPVPWFAAWFDDPDAPGGRRADFRVVDTPKIMRAVRHKLCWVCGQPLGRVFAMTIGPMCSITRTISEPPSHRDCAVFAARACPFLAHPRMRRNAKDLPDHAPAPGKAIPRNPGAVAVWITRRYDRFNPPGGGVLFMFADDPEEVLWFAEGRSANRAEVVASIDSGMHLLLAEALAQGPNAVKALSQQVTDAHRFLPKHETEPAL